MKEDMKQKYEALIKEMSRDDLLFVLYSTKKELEKKHNCSIDIQETWHTDHRWRTM